MPFRSPRGERRAPGLPTPLTTLIGRDDDLHTLGRMLAQHCLVSLVGPGGVGKTRLALHLGASRQDRYADGVWFVDLTAATDATDVERTTAATLGARERPGQPRLQTLLEVLRPREQLLIVDNCEQVADAAARLVEALLRACDRLAILVTSREALAIAGETVWQVAPLAVPPSAGALPADQLPALPAVRLFVERARAVRASFGLTAENAACIVQICRQLDGLPLALELAAARIASLSIEQIAALLDDRFRLLTSGARTAPARQQALRATLDWSYDLLSEPERVVLRRVAVFVNGWTLSAAEQVCAAEAFERAHPADERLAQSDLLHVLARLVSRSLVRADHDDDGAAPEVRYRLLETVRQYAWERLQAAGEAETARSSLAAWCADLGERAELGMFGPEQVRWLVVLGQEYDNLRAALAWCQEFDVSLGLRIAASLLQFWRVKLLLSEGRQSLTALLARQAAPTIARARALLAVGVLAHWQLDVEFARASYEEALEIGRAQGDHALVGRGLRELAFLTWVRLGDHAAAWALFEEGVALSEAAGDRRGVASHLMQQGRLAAAEGDFRRALRVLDESVRRIADLGDLWQLVIALEEAGGVALVVGQDERAVALFEEALEAGQAMETAGFGMIHRRCHRGLVAYWRGDADTAVQEYSALLAITREHEHLAGVADNVAAWGERCCSRATPSGRRRS